MVIDDMINHIEDGVIGGVILRFLWIDGVMVAVSGSHHTVEGSCSLSSAYSFGFR